VVARLDEAEEPVREQAGGDEREQEQREGATQPADKRTAGRPARRAFPAVCCAFPLYAVAAPFGESGVTLSSTSSISNGEVDGAEEQENTDVNDEVKSDDETSDGER
jgi:hypothetical protein